MQTACASYYIYNSTTIATKEMSDSGDPQTSGNAARVSDTQHPHNRRRRGKKKRVSLRVMILKNQCKPHTIPQVSSALPKIRPRRESGPLPEPSPRLLLAITKRSGTASCPSPPADMDGGIFDTPVTDNPSPDADARIFMSCASEVPALLKPSEHVVVTTEM